MHGTRKALGGRKRIPWLFASLRHFEPPEHVPRTSARAHTCTAVFTRASCVARNREHENRPAGGRAKNADVQETYIWYRGNQVFPSGCGRLEIPRVSQVATGEHRRPHFHKPTCCIAARCDSRLLLKSGGSVGWHRSACVQDGTHTRIHRSTVRSCHQKDENLEVRSIRSRYTQHQQPGNYVTLSIRDVHCR